MQQAKKPLSTARRIRAGSYGGMANRFVKMLEAGVIPDRTTMIPGRRVKTTKAPGGLK